MVHQTRNQRKTKATILSFFPYKVITMPVRFNYPQTIRQRIGRNTKKHNTEPPPKTANYLFDWLNITIKQQKRDCLETIQVRSNTEEADLMSNDLYKAWNKQYKLVLNTYVLV